MQCFCCDVSILHIPSQAKTESGTELLLCSLGKRVLSLASAVSVVPVSVSLLVVTWSWIPISCLRAVSLCHRNMEGYVSEDSGWPQAEWGCSVTPSLEKEHILLVMRMAQTCVLKDGTGLSVFLLGVPTSSSGLVTICPPCSGSPEKQNQCSTHGNV